MPYKLIGRRTDFKGKSLWQILGNLKNFGVGRKIGRNMFQRYPEPCYITVLKCEALPNPKVESYDDPRKMIVLSERVFRGIKQNSLVQIESASYKNDYFLVPKHKEAEFCRPTEPKNIRIFPDKMELPPLLKEYTIRQMKAAGTPITEAPKMKIQYNKYGIKTYKVAEEGETPTEPEPAYGFGKPVAPRLLENIKEY